MRKSLPGILLVWSGILFLVISCNLVEYQNAPYFQEFRFSVNFNLSSTQNSVDLLQHLNLGDLFSQAGIDTTVVWNVACNSIQVKILSRDGQIDTLSGGSLSFKKMVPIIGENLLFDFSNISLMPNEEMVLSPFAESDTVSIDRDGLAKLESLLTRWPAATIVFFFRSSLKNPPVNLDVTINFILQVLLWE